MHPIAAKAHEEVTIVPVPERSADDLWDEIQHRSAIPRKAFHLGAIRYIGFNIARWL